MMSTLDLGQATEVDPVTFPFVAIRGTEISRKSQQVAERGFDARQPGRRVCVLKPKLKFKPLPIRNWK